VKIEVVAPLLVLLSLLVSVASFAQDAPIDPNAAKVEFESDQIRVLRAFLAPHQRNQMHSHPSRFGVTLTKNDLRFYFPDGATKTSALPAGAHFWTEPITHSVENLADAPMQNIEIEWKRAKAPGVEVKPVAVESQAKGTAEDPVAVEQEPHHKVIFENQYVRVLDVVVNPGETTLFHRHSLDNLAVILTDAENKNQSPGQDWNPAPAKAGSVGFRPGTTTPYVHRITNAGTTVFHVLDVEILP
jgi:quercetin dioxygenase-like cupin family protein